MAVYQVGGDWDEVWRYELRLFAIYCASWISSSQLLISDGLHVDVGWQQLIRDFLPTSPLCKTNIVLHQTVIGPSNQILVSISITPSKLL